MILYLSSQEDGGGGESVLNVAERRLAQRLGRLLEIQNVVHQLYQSAIEPLHTDGVTQF